MQPILSLKLTFSPLKNGGFQQEFPGFQGAPGTMLVSGRVSYLDKPRHIGPGLSCYGRRRLP